jgi:hypothetical protein
LPTESIDKRWKAISAVGAIVASTATAIFRPPPVGDPQSFIALGTLLSSVTSGVLYVAMTRFSAKRHVRAWIAAAIAGSAGAVWCHSYYGALTDTRVAVYQDQQFVIGDEYTAEGAAWAAAHGHDANALLFDFSGVATNAWTRESIERVKGRMRLSYYAVFPLVAIAILSTVQAVDLGKRSGRKSRAGVTARSSGRS